MQSECMWRTGFATGGEGQPNVDDLLLPLGVGVHHFEPLGQFVDHVFVRLAVGQPRGVVTHQVGFQLLQLCAVDQDRRRVR